MPFYQFSSLVSLNAERISSCLMFARVLIPSKGDFFSISGVILKEDPSALFTTTTPSFFEVSNTNAKFCLADYFTENEPSIFI